MSMPAPSSKRTNSLVWIFEPFEQDPGFVRTKLFSCEAAYFDGRLCLAVGDKKEPWNGLLVCTSYDRQASLTKDFPFLVPHPFLGKWLYLSRTHSRFEPLAMELANLALIRDPRIGVEPKPRKRAPVSKTAKPKAR